MFWHRNKTEFEIYVVDPSNEIKSFKVKVEVTPEEILQMANIPDAYLVLDGMNVNNKNIVRIIREGSTFYAVKIKDKG